MKHGNAGTVKRSTVWLLLVAAIAMATAWSARGLKRDLENTAQQAYASYYSPNAAASQETSEKPTQPVGSTAPPASETPAADRETYLITLYRGQVGVFRAGESEPFLTAPIQVYLLPQADREYLEQGVRVTGMSAVKAVLEDYE